MHAVVDAVMNVRLYNRRVFLEGERLTGSQEGRWTMDVIRLLCSLEDLHSFWTSINS
jgi:hypothetical protein